MTAVLSFGENALSISIIIPTAIAGCLVLFFVIRAVSWRAGCKDMKICITYKGKSITFRALCDSGNLLRDPLSACAVIPVDVATAAPLLPPALLDVLQEATPTTKLPSLPDAILHRIHLLPAKGATGERLLISWPIEHIFLEDERGSRRELSARIAPIPLHAKEYAAIVPTELLR